MNTTNYILKKSTSERRPSSVQVTEAKQQQLHNANRELTTDAVLNHLRIKLPQQYELAEIVGQWVWLDCQPDKNHPLAKSLWQLGFHWNQRRSLWQHPCGACAPFDIHSQDPRAKYGSYFAADQKPA